MSYIFFYFNKEVELMFSKNKSYIAYDNNYNTAVNNSPYHRIIWIKKT